MEEEYYQYEEDLEKNIKKCKCDVKAFMYTNISTCYKVYTCGKSWDEYLKSKGKPKSTSKKEKEIISCGYRLEEKDSSYTFPIVYSPIPISKNAYVYNSKIISKKTKLKDLKRKVDFFLFEKKYVTFQQIEFMCKDFNIDIYDHHKEDLNDFCDRLLAYEL